MKLGLDVGRDARAALAEFVGTALLVSLVPEQLFLRASWNLILPFPAYSRSQWRSD